MRIIARRTLREFWTKHADAEQPLKAWYAHAKKADWETPADIKNDYASASVVANNRVVLGNDYRLIVAVNYRFGILFIRFIGTHSEYDKVDVETV